MERPHEPRTSSADHARAPGGPGRSTRGRSVVGGLVLCGGASRRMGTDKAGLELAGRALIEHATLVVAARAERVWLACGALPRHAALGYALALDRAPGLGPLAGLEAGVSAARDAGADCVLVLACDMPRADARIFDLLLARTIEQDLDGCVLASARGPEPLYAVYRTRLAPLVAAALDAGVRRLDALPWLAFSGGRAARIGTLGESELAPELAGLDPALNLNTPDELRRARAASERRSRRASNEPSRSSS
jgi:molybdenum cofactor guanylyltransferase